MAATIQTAFPEIEKATRLFPDYLIFQKDKDNYWEESIAYADSSIFSVFTVPLVSGNPATVLNAPHQIVLSETAARKYFGTLDVVGKGLIINGNEKDPAMVTGVMKDMPLNSHFRTDILVSMKTLGTEWGSNWKRFFFYTYLLLPENSDIPSLNAKITDLIKKHTDQSQSEWKLSLEPLKKVYLEGKPRGTRAGTSTSGSWSNVYVFSVISMAVLFIACFNFVNLTTASSLRRTKEIGVRKVLGGERKQLIVQFLLDALLLSLIAFGLAVMLCFALADPFNTLAGKTIVPNNIEFIRDLLLLLPLASFVALVAGIYPAFFLSGMLPVNSLKGRVVTGFKGVMLRKGLVVVQFSASIILIVATIVVSSQLDFMKNSAPGFKKDHMLVIDFQFDGRIPKHAGLIKHQFAGITNSGLVSMSSCVPGKVNHIFPTMIENKDADLQEFQMDSYFIDHDFLKQYEISMAAGRNFSASLSSDSTEAMLINESASKALGFSSPDQALGKRFQQLNRKGVIIGVTKDFHFHSFQEKVRPLTLRIAPGFFTCLTVNVPAQNLSMVVDKLRNEWHGIVAGLPFIYSFVDDAYYQQYVSEERFGKLFSCFALLAVLLSCLGLFGLTALSITHRTKEIGIRKVLGSSVNEIVRLISGDFFVLILIAMLLAIPSAWYFMDRWLKGFAYRINLAVWMFAISGGVALFTALITTAWQTIKAALSDPVQSLRAD